MISFDSRRAIAADDPLMTTVLLVDGKEFRATGWKGTAERPHHREGILRFPDAGSNPNAVEVRMQRKDEPAPRVFRWTGAELG